MKTTKTNQKKEEENREEEKKKKKMTKKKITNKKKRKKIAKLKKVKKKQKKNDNKENKKNYNMKERENKKKKYIKEKEVDGEEGKRRRRRRRSRERRTVLLPCPRTDKPLERHRHRHRHRGAKGRRHQPISDAFRTPTTYDGNGTAKISRSNVCSAVAVVGSGGSESVADWLMPSPLRSTVPVPVPVPLQRLVRSWAGEETGLTCDTAFTGIGPSRRSVGWGGERSDVKLALTSQQIENFPNQTENVANQNTLAFCDRIQNVGAYGQKNRIPVIRVKKMLSTIVQWPKLPLDSAEENSLKTVFWWIYRMYRPWRSENLAIENQKRNKMPPANNFLAIAEEDGKSEIVIPTRFPAERFRTGVSHSRSVALGIHNHNGSFWNRIASSIWCLAEENIFPKKE
ncbi:unnamed protein product, partial [Nesidiocoris tenuis]